MYVARTKALIAAAQVISQLTHAFLNDATQTMKNSAERTNKRQI